MHSIKANLDFSTVEWYKKGSFAAPMTLSLSGQHIVSGINVPRYTRFDFELRLFF